MNIAIEKTYKNYTTLSRYSGIPYYYNVVDNRYFSGQSRWLNNSTPYTVYTIEIPDSLDSIALQVYGNPTYYWIIADFNRITDPFQKLQPGTQIKVPDFSDIKFT